MRRLRIVISGIHAGSAGFTYSLAPSASTVACRPHRTATNRKTEPAAQACGTFAPRYGTGKLAGTRGRPENSSGSRRPTSRSAASKIPFATCAASAA